MVAHACSPSYSGGWDGRIAQEFKSSLGKRARPCPKKKEEEEEDKMKEGRKKERRKGGREEFGGMP
jgi:hypothetical protein